ncbi:hypothetical protein LEN26_009957 [Aphanomyces euteiches]|nr:hypothetical protein LEN26_009957 [Aphanomyces euteiches]
MTVENHKAEKIRDCQIINQLHGTVHESNEYKQLLEKHEDTINEWNASQMVSEDQLSRAREQLERLNQQLVDALVDKHQRDYEIESLRSILHRFVMLGACNQFWLEYQRAHFGDFALLNESVQNASKGLDFVVSLVFVYQGIYQLLVEALELLAGTRELVFRHHLRGIPLVYRIFMFLQKLFVLIGFMNSPMELIDDLSHE